MKIWEPKPPGTFWATPGLLWDCFTFTFYINLIVSKLWGYMRQIKRTRNVYLSNNILRKYNNHQKLF
jgi:hypothetical protein